MERPTPIGIGDDTCQRCHGEGYVVVCVDDLCANNDECIHGDGEVVCPERDGVGSHPIPEADDDQAQG